MNLNPHFPRLMFLLLAAIFTLGAQAAIPAENQRKLDELDKMTGTLKTNGLALFLAEAPARGWVAPKMFSAWYVGKLPEDANGEKLVESAKSEFGLEIARQLTLVAEIVRGTKDSTILETQLEVLFTLISWLGSETAYSNMLLQERADDIASIAATKLMCDLNYPMEKAEKAMKRFDDRSWGKPENSRRVLFEESGGAHFAPSTEVVTQQQLDKEFREGVSLVLRLGNISARSDLEIFSREVYQQGETRGDLENTWTKREHVHFAQAGFRSMNLENLVQLYEFRKRHGKFPTKPENIQPFPGESPVKAAFREISWENPYGIGGAWATYEAYLQNRLADAVFRESAQATDQKKN